MGFLNTVYRLVEPGAKLHPIELLPFYLLPSFFYFVSGTDWGADIVATCLLNLFIQGVLFLLVVQIPTAVTGHMSYVDIGWPCGLVALAITCLVDGNSTDPTRKNLAATCLLLHGSRMAIGALVLFFPYVFKDDLSRYQYAKSRFVAETDSPSLWPLKQQHDTLMQMYANTVTLAGPFILMATNPNPSLHPVEILGGVMWACCSVCESTADLQMNRFVKAAKKNGDIRTAVLGYAPYDKGYFLWTICRHPNYFFEWMCWNSFIVMAVPSVVDLYNDPGQSPFAKAAFVVLLYFTSRSFYDCLLYWTGAEPAEARSVGRRPDYKKYQEITRVFWPVWVPFFAHHQTPGWPRAEEESERLAADSNQK